MHLTLDGAECAQPEKRPRNSRDRQTLAEESGLAVVGPALVGSDTSLGAWVRRKRADDYRAVVMTETWREIGQSGTAENAHRR